MLNWNDFFQFVIFYGAAPMPALFYTVLIILPNYEGKITWDCVSQLFIYLRRNLAICPEIKQIFSEHDINNDGEVSLAQFFNFAATTTALYQPFYDFRITLIEKIIGTERLITILNRKLHISDIKFYQLQNSDKLPPEPCFGKLKRLLKGYPHPDAYNYDSEEMSFSYLRFVVKYVRLFKPQLTYKHEGFQMKNLGRFGGTMKLVEPGSDPNVKVSVKDKSKVQGSSSDILVQIDKFYIQYRTNNPEKQNSIKQESILQRAISFQQSENSLPASARSILKAPSHLNTPIGSSRKMGTPGTRNRVHGNRHLSIGHENKLLHTQGRLKRYNGSTEGENKQNSAQSLTMMSEKVRSMRARKKEKNDEEKADSDPLLSPVQALKF